MKDKVSIIIVNWNGLAHLQKCLPSLLELTYTNYEIVLVDNGSTDESVSYAKQIFPAIQIVQNQENKGFAEANNQGYAVATGEYILFLNNDTYVTPDFLTTLVTVLENDQTIGGVQPRIMLMSDKDRYDSVGSFLTYTGFLYHYGYLQKDAPKYHQRLQLYTAKGACMLFRKAVIDQVGLFDERFFAYFEETDFCHRVWLSGYRIIYEPTSVIYHQGGGTSNGMKNAFIQFHSFKNRINCYLKNLSIGQILIILPIHLVLAEGAAMLFLIKSRTDLFVAIQRAIWWNITNLSPTLIKRKQIQAQRKVSDHELSRTIMRNPSLVYYLYLFSNRLDQYNDTQQLT